MPGALKDLVNTLTGSRDGWHPSTQAFPPLDIDQIAGDLRLDARAHKAGENDQPPSESAVEDLTELDIKAEIERRARKAGEEYRSQLELYEGRIRRASLSTDQSVLIEAAGESALTDLRVHALVDLDHLHSAHKEVKGRERELNDFCKRNALIRLPTAVSPGERTVRLLVLAIFVVLESILNGIFFAAGSETGLIGGVTQAFVLSLLNIGSAVLYARYGLPLVIHVWPSLKALGVVVTTLYAIWALTINLVIAHFRELFLVHENGHVLAADIWVRLTTAPFASIVDSQSWLLAALGIGLSILALIDAAGLDDLYPGYGATGRRQKEAIKHYADHKTRCLVELTHLRDEAISDMREVISLIRSAEFDLRLAVEGRSRLHRDYCAFLLHLTDCYQRLLRRYYEVNGRARQSRQPDRFLAQPSTLRCLEQSALADLSDLKNDTRKHAIDRMEHFIKAVNEQFEEEATKYHTVAGLTTPEADHGINA